MEIAEVSNVGFMISMSLMWILHLKQDLMEVVGCAAYIQRAGSDDSGAGRYKILRFSFFSFFRDPCDSIARNHRL